jgi:hypothetical protein
MGRLGGRCGLLHATRVHVALAAVVFSARRVSGRFVFGNWSRLGDSNPGPMVYEVADGSNAVMVN